MRCLFQAWVLTLLLTQAAAAGPWPRERGEGFNSTVSTYRYAPLLGEISSDAGIYVEYGLGRQLTLGLDAMDDSGGYSHVFAFIRIPVSPGYAPLKYAATLGLGKAKGGDQWGQMVRASFSAGRGFRSSRPGWWVVTAAVDHHASVGDPTFKLDMTLGTSVGADWKTFFDLETSYRSKTETSMTLRGSVAVKMRGKRHFVFGVEAKDAGGQSYGVRAGIWQQF